MSYDIHLRKTDLYEDPFFLELEHTALQEDEQNDYNLLMLNTETASKYLDEIIYTYQYPEVATEGLIGSIYDVISAAIRTATRFVTDAAKWLTKKIKSIINIRKKQKEYRDKKMETLSSIYNGLNNDEKIKANRRFLEYTVSYTPSYIEYSKMCIAFSSFTKALNEHIDLYMTKDVTIFATESPEKKSKPTWVTSLYNDNTSRAALELYGISYEENNFVQKSPFKTMLNGTLGELKYDSIENVKAVNSLYLSHCWTNLKQIVALRDRFERFERELKDKQRELARNISKVDKKEAIKACNSVILSVSLSSRLTAYLTNIDEALDTRRGWLIDKAIKACSSEE